MSKPFTMIGAIIFLIVALAHAYRIYAGWSVVVGGHEIPVMASWAGAAVSALLAYGLFTESRR
jgi:high-affinity Fe2+/Pb2+ permease